MEIETTDRLLGENRRSLSHILRNLNLVVQQIEARKKLVAVLEKEIRVMDEEIRGMERQIKRMDGELEVKKEEYAASVRRFYLQRNKPVELLFVLSADGLAQSIRRMLYLREYADGRRRQAMEIVAQQQRIVSERKALVAGRQAKERLADTKKSEESRLHREENVKKTEVAGLQKNVKRLQSEMDRKKQQAAALDREITRIIAEDVAKAKRAARTEPKTERKAETKGGYAMTREERSLSTNFAENKGRLPFPLKGSYRIVGRFGQQQYGELKNTKYNNNGIEIRTAPGTHARAVFEGVVAKIFVIPGYQNSVFLRHGNYLTLYSCLERVFVKQGDRVRTGQEIGRIFSDSETGGETVLHFELWKEQKKENPEVWLNK
jgi:septal ring factor EnvC (AmiA/AmiB activator)